MKGCANSQNKKIRRVNHPNNKSYKSFPLGSLRQFAIISGVVILKVFYEIIVRVYCMIINTNQILILFHIKCYHLKRITTFTIGEGRLNYCLLQIGHKSSTF